LILRHILVSDKIRNFNEINRLAFKSDRLLEGREVKAYKATLLKSTLAPLPVATITTLQVKEALASMKAATAHKTLTRIAAILDWAKVAGKRTGDNPARLPKNEKQHIVPAKPKPVHLAAMPWAEVPAFMRELQAIGSSGARALTWTILTAARTGETLRARWGEIEGDKWIIPAERMKQGKAHEVPLAPEALALLGKRKADGAFLFPGATGRALGPMTMSRDMLHLLPAYKVHGFRSTFTDWAAEHGYPSELREMALAHSVGDDTEKAYRRTTLVNKRREMMAAWAAFALGV
jgi:integrase